MIANRPQRSTPSSSLKRVSLRKRHWWLKLPTGDVYPQRRGDIVCADALDVLSSLRKEIADIVFLDPPFNLGKTYARKHKKADRLNDAIYQDFITKILARSVEVLRPGGALYLYHVPKWAVRFANFLHDKLDFRHWIAISMKNGFARGKKLYPAHYALLYYTKGEPSRFLRPKMPVPTCRHCKKYLKDYGGYKRFVEKGINLSDVWEDLSPVRHKKYKHRSSNELPMDIPLRVVEISGKHNGLFVDVFAGTGTSVAAALGGKMRFIASDREKEHCRIIRKRLAAPSRKGTHDGGKH